MLLIVEIVPYVAFLGAAALVGWVGFDLLRERKRKTPAEAPQDSGRGLAGPPQPMNGEHSEEAEVVAEPDREVSIAPAEELVLPNSHAVDVASETEQCEDRRPEPEPEEVEASSDELTPEVEEDLDSDETVILVRRDPSVRVFDTAVAASERKVASE